MLEKDMEDLLWRYPDDFFPGRGFKPVARQFTLSGAGRLDISFRDNLERLWVIEVKAVAVRTEVADQVYRYAQSLRDAHPDDRPFPAVVAPVINATVREHFDRWGIEYYEIPEAMFRRVATERGVEMEPTEPGTTTQPANPTTSGTHTAAGVKPQDGWYTVEFAPGKCPPRWEGKPTWWHHSIAGKTVCGAHSKTTAVSDSQVYRTAPEVPNGRECKKCVAALPKGS